MASLEDDISHPKMKKHWNQTFEEIFQDFHPDEWRLDPTNTAMPGDWKSFDDNAKVSFECEGCRRTWTSMKGRAIFWFKVIEEVDAIGEEDEVTDETEGEEEERKEEERIEKKGGAERKRVQEEDEEEKDEEEGEIERKEEEGEVKGGEKEVEKEVEKEKEVGNRKEEKDKENEGEGEEGNGTENKETTQKKDQKKTRRICSLRFELYGQKCEICTPTDFQTPIWYKEEVDKVLRNVHQRIGEIFYGFPSQEPDSTKRGGFPRRSHNATLCEACHKGVCSRDKKGV